ncbi:MAG: THUMP-like domain-containing protein [Flavobacteriaceae bacterium]
MNPRLTEESVQRFMSEQSPADVANLVFQPPLFEGIANAEIVYQLEAREKLRKKQPEWAETAGLLFAPPKAIEQCSSVFTAAYKAEVANTLVDGDTRTAVDLTAGFGVDTHAISKTFNAVVAVEKDARLAELSSHNFKQLNALNIEVHTTSAEAYLAQMPKVDFLFLDPDRRDETGTKRIGFEYYAPNIIEQYSSLLNKARVIGIKVSPMIDVSYAEKLLPDLFRVDLISVENELKELVLWLSAELKSNQIKLVHAFLYKHKPTQLVEESADASDHFDKPLLPFEEASYLIDPAAAFVKSRRFSSLLERHPELHFANQSSFLLTAKEAVHGIPGRLFQIEELIPYSKKNLKRFSKNAFSVQVKGRKQRADEVRKALNLKESESAFLFLVGSDPGLIIRATKVNN